MSVLKPIFEGVKVWMPAMMTSCTRPVWSPLKRAPRSPIGKIVTSFSEIPLRRSPSHNRISVNEPGVLMPKTLPRNCSALAMVFWTTSECSSCFKGDAINAVSALHW